MSEVILTPKEIIEQNQAKITVDTRNYFVKFFKENLIASKYWITVEIREVLKAIGVKEFSKDYIEFVLANTLLDFTKAGWKVTYTLYQNGNYSVRFEDPIKEELAALRRNKSLSFSEEEPRYSEL